MGAVLRCVECPPVGGDMLWANMVEAYAKLLHAHGALSDRVESRKAFAEKRKPNWKGWDNPGDRERTPKFKPGK